MNKNFKVKPYQGITLNYFSLYLNYMPTIKHIRESIDSICKNRRGDSALFYTFGAFDATMVGISDDSEILNKMQKTKAYQNVKGVMDYFIHYGMVLSVYPEKFDFSKAVKENPIMGTVAIKIRRKAWDEIFKEIKSIKELKANFDLLLNEIIQKTKKRCPLNSEGYKAILSISFEVEDVIIILLTRSFQFIKLFSTNIRSLELKDFISTTSAKKVKIRHVIASTTTTLGTTLSDGRTLRIPPNKNDYDNLKWITFFKGRPGHLQNLIDSISTISKGMKNQLQIAPVAGRNDLIVHQKSLLGNDIREFLNIHFYLVKRLEKNRSVFSSETYISFPTLDRVESKEKPAKLYPYSLSIKGEIKELIMDINRDRYLHLSEKETFVQILRKFGSLLEDRYLQDSFMTLAPVIFRGIGEYLKLKERRFDKESELIDLWTSFVELCVATRYQSTPPVGETAISPTLGVYSMGQKLLVLLDLLGNRIIKMIAESCKNLGLQPLVIASISVNSPSPFTIPFLSTGTSFIFLPPRPLFHPKFLMVSFFHELGHVLLNIFEVGLEKVYSKREFRNLAETFEKYNEACADFFVVKVLFDFKWDDYRKFVKNLLFSSLKIDSKTSKKLHARKEFHIEQSQALFNKLKSSEHSRAAKKHVSPLEKSIGLVEIKNWLGAIAKWDDEILHRVKETFNSQNQQQKFWDLWIYLYSLGEECFYRAPKKF